MALIHFIQFSYTHMNPFLTPTPAFLIFPACLPSKTLLVDDGIYRPDSPFSYPQIKNLLPNAETFAHACHPSSLSPFPFVEL